MPSEFPLPPSTPGALNFRARPLAELDRLIRTHIDDMHYPGCQIALARHGQLALYRTYGDARVVPEEVAAVDDTLWLLFSNTKVLTMAAVSSLVEEGALSFHDRVTDHIPEFAAHGKDDITLFQLATHQAGFPDANVSRECWADHAQMRAEVCEFQPEWPAGSKVHYHGRSAHLVLAMVIEAVMGRDFRDVIRERVIGPLGLVDELFVGVPPEEQQRCADVYAPADSEARDNSPEFREAGLPHGGAFGTARAMAAFYQMMIGGGRLGAVRLFSKRMVEYVTRDFTGDRPDEGMAGIPMHRGLGPHSRGTGGRIRGLGSIAAPETFGHGGVGSSYCWADPTSGVSFAYLTNFVQPDPWHSARLDRISNLVHAAIEV
ncbi:MAG: beta-lactamase family protein [Alphaproteobacteria bacterium]|nr:beta-lactamase family protein [Alphaproteobacteria bacterium]